MHTADTPPFVHTRSRKASNNKKGREAVNRTVHDKRRDWWRREGHSKDTHQQGVVVVVRQDGRERKRAGEKGKAVTAMTTKAYY